MFCFGGDVTARESRRRVLDQERNFCNFPLGECNLNDSIPNTRIMTPRGRRYLLEDLKKKSKLKKTRIDGSYG